MSNLSDLLPAGAGAKSATFTADGTLPSGQTVALQSDGTVKAVEETSITESVGTITTFESATSNYISSTFDSSNNKVVIIYADAGNSGYGTAVVGTVSGTSISFGTPVVFASAGIVYLSATFDTSNNKVVASYRDPSAGYGYSIVGTVSGTSISFGSAVSFHANSTNHISSTFDTLNNKVVIGYADDASANYGTAIVGTVSGTSISFGSDVIFSTVSCSYTSLTYDSSSNKVVIAFNDGTNSEGKAIVGTVSGTSISFGTAVTFEGATSFYISISYDTKNNKVVVAYRDAGNLNYGTAAVGTVSDTSISFGTPVVFESGDSTFISSVFDSEVNKVSINYSDDSNAGAVTFVTGTVSGTSITFGTPTLVATGYSGYNSAVFDSNEKRVVHSFRTSSTGNYGQSVVIRNAGTTTNVADFVGITDQAIANAATGSVVVEGGQITNTSLIPNLVRAGTASIFANSSGGGTDMAMAFDSTNNKFTIFYYDQDNSNRNSVIVGTVSGDTITYGTSVSQTSNSSTIKASAYDANAGKVVFSYADASDSNKGKAVVGTISGTTISFGTVVEYATNVGSQAMTYDSTNQKIVIAYRDLNNSGYGTAIVGTVSGTSISFGTATVFESASASEQAATFDANAGKVVIVYNDIGNSYHGTAVVGTVSGTSISFGTPVVFKAATTQYMAPTYDSTAQKVVIGYQDAGAGNEGRAVVGTVSGTSISFGSEATFYSGSTSVIKAQYDSTANKTIIAYRDQSNSSRGAAISGTVSGTSISFGTSNFITSVGTWTNSQPNGIVYDSNAQRVVTAYGYTGSGPAQSEAITLNENSNLTVGSTYYVQDDGSLSTTSSSVTAGKALSATKLLLKG